VRLGARSTQRLTYQLRLALEPECLENATATARENLQDGADSIERLTAAEIQLRSPPDLVTEAAPVPFLFLISKPSVPKIWSMYKHAPSAGGSLHQMTKTGYAESKITVR
jgi:hypothetical protein